MNLLVPSIVLALGAGSSLVYAAAELADGGGQDCATKRSSCETKRSGCDAKSPGAAPAAPAVPAAPDSPRVRAAGSVVLAPIPAPPAGAPRPVPAAAPAVQAGGSVVWASAQASDTAPAGPCCDFAEPRSVDCEDTRAYLDLAALEGEVARLVERAAAIADKCESSRSCEEKKLIEASELLTQRWQEHGEELARQWSRHGEELARAWAEHADAYETHLTMAADALAAVDLEALGKDSQRAYEHARALAAGKAMAPLKEPVAAYRAQAADGLAARARAAAAQGESRGREMEARLAELERLLADRSRADQAAARAEAGECEERSDAARELADAFEGDWLDLGELSELSELGAMVELDALAELAELGELGELVELGELGAGAWSFDGGSDRHDHADRRDHADRHDHGGGSSHVRIEKDGVVVFDSQVDGGPFAMSPGQGGQAFFPGLDGHNPFALRMPPGAQVFEWVSPQDGKLPGPHAFALGSEQAELHGLVRELRDEVSELRAVLGDLRAQMRHLSEGRAR